MPRKLNAIILVGILFLSQSEHPLAAEISYAAAINIAGLQRMLSQRIGKSYCQVGLKIDTDSSRQQLYDAIALFDDNLSLLEEYANNEAVQSALKNVRDLWTPVKATATDPITLEGAKLVAYLNDDLLYASHKVVQLLQDAADTPHARLVNISGRQRMLSQRLAKLYMLQIWGINTLTIRDEIEVARNEFTGALATLQAAPENTEAINQRLNIVAGEWTWVKQAMDMVDADPFPKTMADVSESILVNMHEITKLYEKQAENLPLEE